MSEQIVYRMRANRQKMIFGNDPIPDPTLNESFDSTLYYNIRYAYDGDSLSEYEGNIIVKAKSSAEAISKAKRELPDGRRFRVDGSFSDLADYKKQYKLSNIKVLESVDADIPEPTEDSVENSEVVDLVSGEEVNGGEDKRAWATCHCGNKEFVEENGEIVCNACGRPAILEQEVDDEGGELPKKDQMRESSETVGSHLDDEDKKRPKGHRIIRSEPHPMTTATRPNIDAAIAESLGMRIKETRASSDEERIRLITNPAEKKKFIAVNDIFAEYGGRITGDREVDKKLNSLYDKYVTSGNYNDLKVICGLLFDYTGDPTLRP